MKRAADDETVVDSEKTNPDTNGNEQSENGSAPPLKKAKETDDSSPAPAITNVNALLSNLAAQKAALQAKLQQQKQHLQQEELLKKAITVKQLKDQKPEMNDVQKRFADLQARLKDKLPKKEEPPKEQEKKEVAVVEEEKEKERHHREDRHREDKDRHRDDKDRHRDDKDRHRDRDDKDRHRDDKDRHRDDKDRHRDRDDRHRHRDDKDRHRDDKDRHRDRDDKDRHRDDKDRHHDKDRHRDDRHRDDKDRHRDRDDKDRHRDDRRRDDRHRDDRDKRDKRRSRDDDRRRKESKTETEKDRFIPPPLRLDDKGREIDEQGNLIKQETQNIATIKLNLKTKKKELKEPIIIQKEEPKKQVFYDPTLATEAPERKRRALTFVEPGSILKKAEKIRAKSRGEYVPEEPKKQDKLLESKAESTIIAANMPELDLKIAKKISKESVPEIEWWDKYLLYQENYDDIEKFKTEEVTHYIEHPVPLKPIGEKDVPPMPMYLTERERKKLRRTTRREREREKQEQIILGIMEPPKPKVRLANLMRVLGTEATADPTQIEHEVKRQMAERVAAHDARNQANKLTKEEKKAKKKKKFEEDLKKSVFVLAFKVGDLSHPKLKFKVDATARENGLGGCAILTKENNLIIVEGGQKSVRKFKKVMLNKVKWNEEKKTEEGEEKLAVTEEKMAGNKCILLWEGNVTKPNFNGQFRFEGLPSEEAIRKYLNHRWSEHYWDMCKNYKEEDHSNELLPV